MTTKEGDVLRLLDQGLSNKAIGNALDVSGETVKWHLKNLFAKLSASTRTQAVSRAGYWDCCRVSASRPMA